MLLLLLNSNLLRVPCIIFYFLSVFQVLVGHVSACGVLLRSVGVRQEAAPYRSPHLLQGGNVHTGLCVHARTPWGVCLVCVLFWWYRSRYRADQSKHPTSERHRQAPTVSLVPTFFAHRYVSVRVQVVVAMLITLAGLRVLAGLQPYQREDENNLAEASLWVTFLTL